MRNKFFFPIQLTIYHQGISADWWTGGHDIAVEGNWEWITNGQPLEDLVWSSNQPEGVSGRDCLMLENGYDYLGRDYTCDHRSYPICQIKN